MKKPRDTIQEEESIILDTKTKEENEQPSILKLPSDEKDISIEGEKIYNEDQSTVIPESQLKEKSLEQQLEDTRPSVEKRLSQIRKSSQSSEEDKTKMKSPLIKDDIVDEKDIQLTKDELQKPSIQTLTSDKTIKSSLSIDKTRPSSTESLHAKSSSIILPNTTEDLTTIHTES
jgi:hypothetical protein